MGVGLCVCHRWGWLFIPLSVTPLRSIRLLGCTRTLARVVADWCSIVWMCQTVCLLARVKAG